MIVKSLLKVQKAIKISEKNCTPNYAVLNNIKQYHK